MGYTLYAAQGVIDNGGFKYFFGEDWPNQPPYSVFVDAYAAIGCPEQAKDLARVAASFPFRNPHLFRDLRKMYMTENYDEDNLHVKGWGEALCGDEEVWQKLEQFILEHRPELDIALGQGR